MGEMRKLAILMAKAVMVTAMSQRTLHLIFPTTWRSSPWSTERRTTWRPRRKSETPRIPNIAPIMMFSMKPRRARRQRYLRGTRARAHTHAEIEREREKREERK